MAPKAPSSSESSSPAQRYAAAGVDLDANERLIPRYKSLAASTALPEVIGGVGPFSGLFDLSRYENPVLVASTDGVGTKVLLAGLLGRFEGVGRDIVNHCVNDILTAGAKPLFFLDYLANNALSDDHKVAVVSGIAEGCRESGMALLGGETADMPGVYRSGDFDLAGTIVGVVEKGREIDGAAVAVGQALVAIPSNGLHTNGYSLARDVLALRGEDAAADRARLEVVDADLGESFADALLRPHRAYWRLLEPVLDRCAGIAHITGGGVPGNLARILPEGTAAALRRGSWPEPPIFARLQQIGGVSDEEMFHVFNMGLGLVLAVEEADLAAVQTAIPEAALVGSVVPSAGASSVQIEGLSA